MSRLREITASLQAANALAPRDELSAEASALALRDELFHRFVQVVIEVGHELLRDDEDPDADTATLTIEAVSEAIGALMTWWEARLAEDHEEQD